MHADDHLRVVLCWHMHQPQYRDPASGSYRLPWTYLHAIKDYVDMAAIIEATPGARAVVNFAPILLEQIDEYARQVREFLDGSGTLHDPVLEALDAPALPVRTEEREALIRACLCANEQRLINRFPEYRALADMAHWLGEHPDALVYLDEQFLVDLLVWYHLAWLGETVRRNDERVQRIIAKGRCFNREDRHLLLKVIGELLDGLIGRYRALAGQGRVELSVTPYAHPILPLLLDLNCARDAMPDVQLPALTEYPGGEARARWHLHKGIETFEHYFGFVPKGCWPAEGAVSLEALELLGKYGFAWAASGEAVLANSLRQQGHADHACKAAWLYEPYAVGTSGIRCFFRDDGLSDLIGFTYANWHGDDAVNNLVHHLEQIAANCKGHPGHTVAIILDGENAWEHYPDNGYHFLTALYQRLVAHPSLNLSTFSACLEETAPRKTLPSVVAGSWVYGTLSTWIGDHDKNHGWDLLGEAKRAFDRAVASGRLTEEQLKRAEAQLAVCEGSDWFWWFGDYNPAETVHDFDHLFRLHMANLYRMLDEPPPRDLSSPVSHGGGTPEHGGAMRRGQAG